MHTFAHGQVLAQLDHTIHAHLQREATIHEPQRQNADRPGRVEMQMAG
jgi:hypothetical protein